MRGEHPNQESKSRKGTSCKEEVVVAGRASKGLWLHAAIVRWWRHGATRDKPCQCAKWDNDGLKENGATMVSNGRAR